MSQHHQGEQARAEAEMGAAGRSARHAGEGAEPAEGRTAHYTRQARDRGMHLLDEQKHSAARQLHTLGEAAHRAAGRFRDAHDDNIAGYIDAMADEVDRFAGYLERRDVRSLVADAQHLAQRRPELFLGGMFVVGLALTRFLKTSARHSDYAPPPESMSPEDQASRPYQTEM
jgi:hypothetical protein